MESGTYLERILRPVLAVGAVGLGVYLLSVASVWSVVLGFGFVFAAFIISVALRPHAGRNYHI